MLATDDVQLEGHTTHYPLPMREERPSAYAERLGNWYANLVPPGHKKKLGQYLTSTTLAEFMASLVTGPDLPQISVLDPGAGAGILSCALCENLAQTRSLLKHINLVAYEIDAKLARYLEKCLAYARKWLGHRGIKLTYEIKSEDFILSYADVLDVSSRLFHKQASTLPTFDVVISNPPYFKVPKSDDRAKAAALVVYGQPNMYALFMAVSAAALKEDGVLVCISPRSYATGVYFRRFRQYFFSLIRPQAIHLFHSRVDAFSKDAVLQENVILAARRHTRWADAISQPFVRVSSSAGTADLRQHQARQIPLPRVLDDHSPDLFLHVPTDDEEDGAAGIMRSWDGSFRQYGIVVSTGPVVPFRARDLLHEEARDSVSHAPLLWMQNVTKLAIRWPLPDSDKAQYMSVNQASKRLLIADGNYVLVRRFSSKEQHRRIVAAPLLSGALQAPLLGIENHLNYIHRVGGSLTAEEAMGLAVFLNSRVVDKYFRTFNGNTQISATELMELPLPPIVQIGKLGELTLNGKVPAVSIDDVILETLLMAQE